MKKMLLGMILCGILLATTGCDDTCSKDLIETVKSPNGKYEIRTYLRNCGALNAYELIADLCSTSTNECKEIYYFYNESDSFVYWIDNENVSINKRTLNIFKDTYHCYLCKDTGFRLYNINDEEIYLINKENKEFKLSGIDVCYIETSSNMFAFDKNNTYNDYDFRMKVFFKKYNIAKEFLIKIDNNKIHIINDDKMTELDRSDFEYLKKILISNNLYDFS